MVIGACNLQVQPTWTLGQDTMSCENYLDILGVNYNTMNSYAVHVDSRITSSHRAMYGLASTGLAYPGLDTAVKVHLWKTVGIPCLTYGLDCVYMSDKLWKTHN